MSSKASHSARGHARKHTTAAKHVSGKSAKHHPKGHKTGHHVTTQGKPQTVGRAIARFRGLALDGVACCTAEALAASLQLQGLSVGDGETLDLFWRAGGDPEAGAPIVAVLEAASEFTLAGYRPVFEEVMSRESAPDCCRSSCSDYLCCWCRPDVADLRGVTRAGQLPAAGLILGLELPGPHAVLATPEGWWSWGELYDPAGFPDAAVEEAWAVTWP